MFKSSDVPTEIGLLLAHGRNGRMLFLPPPMTHKVSVVCNKQLGDFSTLKRLDCRRHRRHHPSVNYSTPQMNHSLKQFYLSSYHVLHRPLPENKTVPYSIRSRSHNVTLTCKSFFMMTVNIRMNV